MSGINILEAFRIVADQGAEIRELKVKNATLKDSNERHRRDSFRAWRLAEDSDMMREPDGRTGNDKLDELFTLLDSNAESNSYPSDHFARRSSLEELWEVRELKMRVKSLEWGYERRGKLVKNLRDVAADYEKDRQKPEIIWYWPILPIGRDAKRDNSEDEQPAPVMITPTCARCESAGKDDGKQLLSDVLGAVHEFECNMGAGSQAEGFWMMQGTVPHLRPTQKRMDHLRSLYRTVRRATIDHASRMGEK